MPLKSLEKTETKPIDVVLDSGAIAALFFKDPNSDRVATAIERYRSLFTLDLAFVEVCSVAWKRIQIFREDIKASTRALTLARDFIDNSCHVIASRELLEQAFKLGLEENVAVYDALFLSLAKRSGTKLLTTDDKLHKKIAKFSKISGLTILP